MQSMPFPFFFNATPTTEIYTLSLHDALPISPRYPVGDLRPVSRPAARRDAVRQRRPLRGPRRAAPGDDRPREPPGRSGRPQGDGAPRRRSDGGGSVRLVDGARLPAERVLDDGGADRSR